MSNTKGKDRIIADLAMLLAAIIWGGGFIAQRYGADHLNHFSFNALRFILASLVLLPVGIRQFSWKKQDVLWMGLAGLCLFIGSALQQSGLATTTASAAGFITGLYVVLVPLYLALFWKTKIPLLNWLSAILALFGTYLLSTSGKGFSFSTGDLLELTGAFVWPFHLIVVGFAAKKIQPFALSTGQFLVCGFLNLICSFFVEPITVPAILSCWPAILYGGLFSVAAGFTLQIVGQAKAPTADAALIMSLEAVFAALFGALILSEKLDTVQIIGSVIIMISIFGVQILSIYQTRHTLAEIKNE